MSNTSLKDRVLRYVMNPHETKGLKEIPGVLRKGSQSECGVVADTMKEVLEDRNVSPVVKLRTLEVRTNQLLKSCLTPDNTNFVLTVQSRLLSRLTVLARHRRDSRNPSRGEDLFGYVSSSSPENTQASVNFLKLLLLCLRYWAEIFHLGPDGQPSAYTIQYDILVREGVWFEDLDDSRQSLTPSNRFLSDIHTVHAAVADFQDRLTHHSDPSSLTPLLSQLRQYHIQINQTIQDRLSNPTSELELNQLLDTSDRLSQALTLYQQSVSPPAHQPMFLEERKSVPPDIDRRISDLQTLITDTRNQLFAKQTMAQGIKSAEQIRKETDEKIHALKEEHEGKMAEIMHEEVQSERIMPGLQQKVNELMAQVDHARMKLDCKLKEMEKMQNQLLNLKYGNEELKKKLGKLGVETEKIDYSGFFTQRNSEEAGKIPVMQRKSGEICNLQEFRHLCYTRDGILYQNSVIDVNFELKMSNLEGKFRITLVNKGQEALERLELVASEMFSEGILLETQPLAPVDLAIRAKIYRIFSISVSRAFQSAPNLVLSYVSRGEEQTYTLKLPIIYPLFVAPLNFPVERVVANWEGLREWEAVAEVQRLHPALRSMGDVMNAARFQGNFVVLTYRELSELGRGEILCLGQLNQFLAWVRIAIINENEQVGAKVTVRCRNLESRNCLLSILTEFLGQN